MRSKRKQCSLMILFVKERGVLRLVASRTFFLNSVFTKECIARITIHSFVV